MPDIEGVLQTIENEKQFASLVVDKAIAFGELTVEISL